ncbi:hypothetical protein [Streptomyces sp. NPDC048496]|uniref:hypothetical protein n=1 Tax=Streptomyces sp. NPDC048496 TaxID=3365558 RepID=UPI003716219D
MAFRDVAQTEHAHADEPLGEDLQVREPVAERCHARAFAAALDRVRVARVGVVERRQEEGLEGPLESRRVMAPGQRCDVEVRVGMSRLDVPDRIAEAGQHRSVGSGT